MKQKLKRLTSGLLSAVMVLTMIAGILPTMALPTEAAADAIDATGEKRPIVPVDTYEELKAALESETDTYICLSNNIKKEFEDRPGNNGRISNLFEETRDLYACSEHWGYDADVYTNFYEDVRARIVVKGNHTLNLNGFTIDVMEGSWDSSFTCALFGIQDGVTFTVEDEWKKNATEASPASEQQGKILYNTDNSRITERFKRPSIRCAIFVSGINDKMSSETIGRPYDYNEGGTPGGKLIINSGYYRSGTKKKFTWNDGFFNAYSHTAYVYSIGYVAILYEDHAEMVVNGGTLVGSNDSRSLYGYTTVQYENDWVDLRTGIIGMGTDCKVTINGGTFIAKDGANVIAPLVYRYISTDKDPVFDRAAVDAQNAEGEALRDTYTLSHSDCFRRYYIKYCFLKGLEVDVRGGEFQFGSYYLASVFSGSDGNIIYGQFCPNAFMDEWMPKNINKYDEETGSFSVAPSFGTPDITTETEYDGSSYDTPGGKVDIGSEVSSRIKYVLWNPDTTLNLTANADGGYYMADYSVKDMISQQEDIYTEGIGYAVSRRYTTWKFWDNSDGKANVSGNPTFEKVVYGDTFGLTLDELVGKKAAYKDVTKWIVRVEVKDELFRHSGLYKSLQSKPSTVFHIYVTDMPTNNLMLDDGYFGYELNHSKGGELLSFSPVESLQTLINMYDLSSAAVTASLDGCTHNHVPYEDITCCGIADGCDSVTFAVKYSLTDKNGNNMQFTLGENVPMVSVAVTGATETGDDTYSFSGSAQLSIPANKTGDFDHNFTEVGNWYQQVGIDANGQPRWAKNYGSAEKALTVGGTGVYTYSYKRADGTVFYAKPVTIVNGNAEVKFEGDGLEFEDLTIGYRNLSLQKEDLMALHTQMYMDQNTNTMYYGHFSMNLKPNAELKRRVENGTAKIKVVMTSYPAAYDSAEYLLDEFFASYEYIASAADEKIFFQNFMTNGADYLNVLNGDYTFVAYAVDTNNNILAISHPLTLTFDSPYTVQSGTTESWLFDSETGEKLDDWNSEAARNDIDLFVGEEKVFDIGLIPEYQTWNWENLTIDDIITGNGGSFEYTLDDEAKTITINALKAGSDDLVIRATHKAEYQKRRNHDGADISYAYQVNVYDTQVFEFDFADDIGYKRKVASPMGVDALITDLTGAEDYVISWLTGTYNSGPKATYIDANKEVTAEIRLNTNEPFNPEVMNPDNIVVVIDGKEYTGRELNGWCTGDDTMWTFHFVWSFGTFHNPAYTYMETAEMDVKAPQAGDSCDLELPGEDAFENFTVTAIEVVQLTEGAGDNDSSNDEGFTRTAADTFLAGEDYRIGFTLEAKTADNIYFDEDMTVLINGEEGPKESVDEGFEEVIAYYYFTPKFGDGGKKPMTGFTVQAVTAPKTGTVPMTEGSLSLKGVAGELETSAIYVAGLTWYIDANSNGVCDEGEIAEVQYQYNEETGEEEDIFVNLNDDGTFKGGTVYSVILSVALSNDEDEDGVDDTTGICLPENATDIPDFPAMVGGEFVEMSKEYRNGILIYQYTFPATENLLNGDVDGNGVVDSDDAELLAEYFAGWPEMELNLAAADMDGDGTVTRRDAMVLARKAAGWTIVIGE